MARTNTLEVTKQYLSNAIVGEELFASRLQRSAHRTDLALLEGLCSENTRELPAPALSPVCQLTDQPYLT